MQDEWRVVPEFPDYEVTKCGKVRRKHACKYGRKHAVEGLSTRPGKDGYHVVAISREGKRTARPVHSLVYSAFVGPIPRTQCVKHKDGRKDNCRLDNLELYCQVKNADLSGQSFGEWTVLALAGRDKCRNRRWLCRCSCGTEKRVGAIALKNGNSRSCGCKTREFLREKVCGERHYAWKGGIQNAGSLAWAAKRLDSLRGDAKRRGKTPIVSSAEDIKSIWERSGGCCESCGRGRDSDVPVHFDHDHTTGVVRGLLCDTCNVALGMVNDSAERLRRLADYIDNSKPPQIAHDQQRAS